MRHFYFIKISKFPLSGVMLMYERTSKDRKKERNKPRALGNAELRVLVRTFFPWDACFPLGRSSASHVFLVGTRQKSSS